MKKLFFAFIPWLFTAFGYKAMAQEEPKMDKGNKETQEIIIRKKGNKDAIITVEIKGDKVMINGKPLSEFKDDEIVINKRKMTIREGNMDRVFDLNDKMNFDFDFDFDKENLRGSLAHMKRTFLGVTTEKAEDGARISEITKESAAEKAGLKVNDIITKVNDTKVDGPQALSEAILAKKPGEEVKLTFKRDGKQKSAKATLQERKDIGARSFSFTGPDGTVKSFTLPPATPNMPRIQHWDEEANGNYGFLDAPRGGVFMRKPRLGLKIQDTDLADGVKVLDVTDSSAAALAGIKKDDLITEIGDVKVFNTDEAREQLQKNSDKSSYNMKVKRNGSEMSFTIKIPKKLKTTNL